ncbi:PA2169 family four-helix-bundle protein [Erythrobacter sp. SCSIO 43205]|uniref:PA2169 family four-helix-bundle protein n=1 Tax=Erythrobacter sp. SCSIO 43205 TaxID=2779361 RepID=UPI001CA85780|nr:PA2169 family four-helix-bundle protein [Erythrobacter sp. SCSIO 43205]UAB79188.1 PA2169 family four-helix-bundle protein [Erythrobacter sp. SCSIO 43205]
MNNIELLKSLTQTTYDSVEGYRLAHEKTDNRALRNAFERRMDQRRQTLEMLNNALAKNGETPITTTSVAGDTHQTFLTIVDSLTDGDDAAIKRVDEGEEYLAGKFREAMERDDLDASARMVIEKASQDVLAGDRFSTMLEEQYV